jgi:serine O-acetyltransferase
MEVREFILDDLYRQCGNRTKKAFVLEFIKSHGFRYLVFYRLTKTKGIKYLLARIIIFRMRAKYGIAISRTVELGSGIRLEHPNNITLNSRAQVGSNVTIYKGATIGSELRGKRIGVPIVGNNVFIGINAVVLGGITIGNDVLISANSFVNFDVPSNSIVIGNPGKIISKNNATQGYIKFPI